MLLYRDLTPVRDDDERLAQVRRNYGRVRVDCEDGDCCSGLQDGAAGLDPATYTCSRCGGDAIWADGPLDAQEHADHCTHEPNARTLAELRDWT